MCSFKPLNPKIDVYLKSSAIIDWSHPEITKLAGELADSNHLEFNTAKNCFLWVRDQIKHSWDFKLNPVTCKASNVLHYKTGYCYAKAHLLAALLRANGIPAGFCYQRLSIEGTGEPFCLHGLNAVYLENFGWYRVDPRGNKEGINAQFDPPYERLAFSASNIEEFEFKGVWPEPIPQVVNVLEFNKTYEEVYLNLPDFHYCENLIQ